MTQRDSSTGCCIQQTRRRHAAGHQLHCFGAAWRCCCCDCHMIQDVPEHPVGSQQGSWGISVAAQSTGVQYTGCRLAGSASVSILVCWYPGGGGLPAHHQGEPLLTQPQHLLQPCCCAVQAFRWCHEQARLTAQLRQQPAERAGTDLQGTSMCKRAQQHHKVQMCIVRLESSGKQALWISVTDCNRV
jgi:hypothetical protein